MDRFNQRKKAGIGTPRGRGELMIRGQSTILIPLVAWCNPAIREPLTVNAAIMQEFNGQEACPWLEAGKPDSKLAAQGLCTICWPRSRNALARPSFGLPWLSPASWSLLYWQIGRDILGRQEHEGWGTKVIDRLAGDLRRAYPDMTGLSPRNLKYMRAFAEAWPDESIVQQAACTNSLVP